MDEMVLLMTLGDPMNNRKSANFVVPQNGKGINRNDLQIKNCKLFWARRIQENCTCGGNAK